MAHAPEAFFEAIAHHALSAWIGELEQHIRAVEHEGRTRGFLPVDGARVSGSRIRLGVVFG